MLQWLAQFLTAPIVNGFLNAYKAKLAAANAQGAQAVDPPAVSRPAEGLPVVAELEEAPAGRALEPVVERELRAALDAPQRGRERGGGHRRIASISSMRWRRVCSARARLRARSPMSRASSGWAR